MNTLHLTYAVEVARCGSITQAAENLYMAQPNLSKALRELEEQMGFAIFRRTSRGVTPTPRGEEFLVCARAMLAQLRGMERLSARSDDAMQRFSLSMPGAGYLFRALSALASSLDAAAPFDVQVREGGALDALNEVAEGVSQLGVARFPAGQEEDFAALLHRRGLESQPLLTFEARVTLSRAHPLAEAESVPLSALRPLPEITEPGEAAPRADDADAPRRLCVSGQANRLALLAALPHAFLWEAPEPAEALLRRGLVQCRCAEGGPRFADALVYPRGQGLSRLELRFLTLAQEAGTAPADGA